VKVLNDGQVELVPLRKLSLHPRNPRQGDVGAIHQSIEEHGFYGALVVQRSTGYVLAGNHRLQAAQHHGAKKVPVIWVDVSDEQALRILLADNRATDLAHYDSPGLAELLQELAEGPGLEGTLYSGDDLDELLASMQLPSDEDWMDHFEDQGDTSEADAVGQITFVLPKPVLERLREHLATFGAGSHHKAMEQWLETL
jgi:hypothetical protein